MMSSVFVCVTRINKRKLIKSYKKKRIQYKLCSVQCEVCTITFIRYSTTKRKGRKNKKQCAEDRNKT